MNEESIDVVALLQLHKCTICSTPSCKLTALPCLHLICKPCGMKIRENDDTNWELNCHVCGYQYSKSQLIEDHPANKFLRYLISAVGEIPFPRAESANNTCLICCTEEAFDHFNVPETGMNRETPGNAFDSVPRPVIIIISPEHVTSSEGQTDADYCGTPAFTPSSVTSTIIHDLVIRQWIKKSENPILEFLSENSQGIELRSIAEAKDSENQSVNDHPTTAEFGGSLGTEFGQPPIPYLFNAAKSEGQEEADRNVESLKRRNENGNLWKCVEMRPTTDFKFPKRFRIRTTNLNF